MFNIQYRIKFALEYIIMITVVTLLLIFSYASAQNIAPDVYNNAIYGRGIHPTHVDPLLGHELGPYHPGYAALPFHRRYSTVPSVPTLRGSSVLGPSSRPAAILRQVHDETPDGSYNYGFETENGIAAQSSGQVKNLGTLDEAQVMQGSYSYYAPDGTPITTNWYADETGFHADGAHLPQGPTGHTRLYK